jgi:hypothetical protein
MKMPETSIIMNGGCDDGYVDWSVMAWRFERIMGGIKSTKVEFVSCEQWRLMEIPRILVKIADDLLLEKEAYGL